MQNLSKGSRIDNIINKGVQKGHFLLSSGLHSQDYVQCAKMSLEPGDLELLALNLCLKIPNEIAEKAEYVVSPAIGALLFGYQVAQILGLKFVFTERKNGVMTLSRSFEVKEKSKVIIIEDVVTTFKSTKECIQALGNVKVEAICSILDRSVVKDRLFHEKQNIPVISVRKQKLETWLPEECPLCLQGLELIKPGSR